MGACARYLRHLRRLCLQARALAPSIYSVDGACAWHRLRALAPAPAICNTRSVCPCRRGCLRPLLTISGALALFIACMCGPGPIICSATGACACRRAYTCPRLPRRGPLGVAKAFEPILAAKPCGGFPFLFLCRHCQGCQNEWVKHANGRNTYGDGNLIW
jgi:hypothetical protein